MKVLSVQAEETIKIGQIVGGADVVGLWLGIKGSILDRMFEDFMKCPVGSFEWIVAYSSLHSRKLFRQEIKI